MLMRRRRLLGPVLPRLLVALLLASAAALLPGAAEAADEGRVGEAVATVERADATAATLGAAQTDGEATQGNGTNKENNLANMIDRALEKEFPDSEGDQGGGDVFAVGDCCGFLESTGKEVLLALVQVVERQGLYLARLLNSVMKAGGGHANSQVEVDLGSKFVYKHLGSMATVGRYKALVNLRQSKGSKGISIAGFASWFIWRSAYLTRVVSWRNRLYMAINWLTTMIFGRDIGRI
ncbi:internal alternative NAD(P)H-ubiquinone oxidoreductase A1, mitochondrial-like [Hordeum vulgare subsp. vulgare]|uniref:internal alternative NAD(P)H-ubiquinone oxidoreductase A1, mitochondrial-like n=1 Tax=Hordeum vulgare subsp. vulgare TaxID=112509 RepID=UPI001D1A48F5|nr:internal alternative NAD(P)H-ubiquinone oxidoreductase A1, mitochondrial-like [Hordeum vulgare subsp. vulgare]